MNAARKSMMVGDAAHGFITELARRSRLSTVVISDILVQHVDQMALNAAIQYAQRAKRQHRVERRERREEAKKLANELPLAQIRKLNEDPALLDRVRQLIGEKK